MCKIGSYFITDRAEIKRRQLSCRVNEIEKKIQSLEESVEYDD